MIEEIYYTSMKAKTKAQLKQQAIRYGVEISKTDTKHTLAMKVSKAKVEFWIKNYKILEEK